MVCTLRIVSPQTEIVVRSNIQVTFKVFGKTRKRQHLEGITMQLLFLLVQRLNCSFL